MPRPVIYYVRHGLTDWNVQQRLQGRHDVPLNAVGCAQAVCCAEILQGLFRRDDKTPESFNYVSSPLVRARKTMEIVRATLGLEPAGYTVEARLAEIAFGKWEGLTYFGKWEGLTYSEVMARDEHIVAERESDKWGFTPPGGESYAQVTIRIRQWYETVDKDTVVTAHGGTARAFDRASRARTATGRHPLFHRPGRGLRLRGKPARPLCMRAHLAAASG